jgi:hypothetical protein
VGDVDGRSKLRHRVRSDGKRHTVAGCPVVEESRGADVAGCVEKGNPFEPVGGMGGSTMVSRGVKTVVDW